MSPLLPKPSPSPLLLRPLLSHPRLPLSLPRRLSTTPSSTPHTPPSSLPSHSLPPRIYDTHTHVSDPLRFPPSGTAQYRPHAAKLADLYAMYRKLGFVDPSRSVKTVLVQPSTYGLDNSCLLHGLEKLTPARGKGVVVVDPGVRMRREAEGELEELGVWWRGGVGGVRVNLKSIGKTLSPTELEALIISYAALLKAAPGGPWSLQIHADLASMTALKQSIHHLTSICSVCIDHYGCPTLPRNTPPSDPHDTRSLPGWTDLKSLMQEHNVFVKISAPYRIAGARHWGDIEELTRELLDVNGGKQVLWASDWPHTRFEGKVDVGEFVRRCVQWCDGDSMLVERLFWSNAERMWREEGRVG
ncbi:TIM barrel metal-dependent hydrolase protein [Rutstroemia sp. NJR-2017a WRK4]|nr:TIM barrel metal-dependent hydrolase protein [Rutstroemia sp. NJR-2017a WRK4]PQE30031.1 TIM barrel metal-dependent hydrolase protein [Rutstroemia sp. NJR-2017a WRK4]